MSKAVKTDHEFNKELFSSLLRKAIAGTTQTNFAKQCGLSTAYICKQCTGNLNNPPMPSTIRAIATNARNGVTYAALLEAAGYDSKKYLDAAIPNSFIKEDNRLQDANFRDLAEGIITRSMLRKHLVISGNTSEQHSFFDLKVDITNSPVEQWYFKFIHSISDVTTDNNALKNRLYAYYGYLSTMLVTPTTYVSYVTDSVDVYNFYVQNPPILLGATVSSILIDPVSFTICKEEYLQTSSIIHQENKISLK